MGYTGTMANGHENDPLHGVTVEAMLISLVERFGWDGLVDRIPVHCFSKDPSLKSSLIILRRTPWAKTKVEALYLGNLRPRSKGRGGTGADGGAGR
jgi:uncharacterized protein (DUF2132 family)